MTTTTKKTKSEAPSGPFNAIGRAEVRKCSDGKSWVAVHPSNGAILGYYETMAGALAAVALHDVAAELLEIAEACLSTGWPLGDEIREAIRLKREAAKR